MPLRAPRPAGVPVQQHQQGTVLEQHRRAKTEGQTALDDVSLCDGDVTAAGHVGVPVRVRR